MKESIKFPHMICTSQNSILFVKEFMDIIDYKKQFVIYRSIFSSTLYDFLQKEKSVEKRKEIFISHCQTFSAAFNSLSAMNDVKV